MTTGRPFLVVVSAGLLCASVIPAEGADLKSGPRAGETLPGPFLSVVAYSGEPGLAGKRTDFVEMFGQSPVVLVFARQMTKPLTGLINNLDAEAGKHQPARLKVIVVLLSNDGGLENNLKEYGEKQAIRYANLAIMDPDGPKLYKLSKEADVTVLLYKRRKVEVNHAFRKGELGDEGLGGILADVPTIAAGR